MRRRQVLRSVALAGTFAAAGCVGQSPSGGRGGDPADTNTSNPTDDNETGLDGGTPAKATDGSVTDSRRSDGERTDSSTPSPVGGSNGTRTKTRTPRSLPSMPDSVTDHTFQVTGVSCGTRTNEASVSVSGPEVVVTGTIWGSDGCSTAVLDAVERSDGELTVRVRETQRDTDKACVQCIVEIDYKTTYVFENDAPDSVTVEHVHGDKTTVVASS